MLSKKLRWNGSLPVTPIPNFHSGQPMEEPLPGGHESPEDTDPTGIQIDLTTLTSTPRSSLFIIDAELNGVPVSALIDSGAEGCFISFEAAARLHPSGRKKMKAPVGIRGATGTIKDYF